MRFDALVVSIKQIKGMGMHLIVCDSSVLQGALPVAT